MKICRYILTNDGVNVPKVISLAVTKIGPDNPMRSLQ